MKLRIGTRGSRLALIQTSLVAEKIKTAYPDVDIDVEVIKTKGDKILNVPLAEIGGKGLFVKEIEDKLLEGRIDLSVNSMKDMPAVLPEGLKLSHCPAREDARDALVTKHDINNISELPIGAVIGTGSKRRSAQLKAIRDDVLITDIRGNVETRINKIKTQNLDGVILAMAGLKRLKFHSEEYKVVPLPMDIMLPSPCQGILALEIRENDEKIHELLSCLKDETTELQAELEREFLYHIEGGCHAPTGAYAQIEEDTVTLTGLFGTQDKLSRKMSVRKRGLHKGMGKDLAEQIKKELSID